MSVPIPYAVSAVAIAAILAFAVTHELLPPLQRPPTASVAVEQLPAPKADPAPDSHPVRTIPIVARSMIAPVIAQGMEMPSAVAAAAPEQPVSIPRASRPKKSSPGDDVCARHGGRRVDDAARRSWYCEFKRAAR